MTENPPTDRLLAAFYAAVEAVAEGKVAEVEIDDRRVDGDEERVLSVSVRNEVRKMPRITLADDE